MLINFHSRSFDGFFRKTSIDFLPLRFVLNPFAKIDICGNLDFILPRSVFPSCTVCRHAVKANDPLAGLELENLVNDLRRCSMPYTCPHGRPTLIEMNYRELEKKFGRSQ